jgi:mono/diheme cytochrome c family protein
MIGRTNVVLAVVFVVVMLLAAAARVDYSRPNYEILPDMKYTPAWTAFSSNPNFRNQRTLQAPVAGTIARGQEPLYYEATPADAIRAGEELLNPYRSVEAGSTDAAAETTDETVAESAAPPVDEERVRREQSVARGHELFRIFCICCHGATGAGDGPVGLRGFPPATSLLTGKSPQMKDGQLFHILTYGQANMPSFAGQLSPSRRWDVINYVRRLQEAAPAAAPAAAEAPAVPAAAAESPQPAADAVSQTIIHSATKELDHGQ